MLNPQLNKNGELQHLLTIEGLPTAVVTHILDTASSFVGVSDRDVKKAPLMRGKSVFNLFLKTRHVPAPPSRLLQSVCRQTSST
jgi:aspartate carbamoyltransferase catalytic subunit